MQREREREMGGEGEAGRKTGTGKREKGATRGEAWCPEVVTLADFSRIRFACASLEKAFDATVFRLRWLL